MTDDDLLRLTGEALAEDDVLDDERWDALAAGQLDDESRAELEALAAESDLAADALIAFAPLDDEATSRLESLFQASAPLVDTHPEGAPTPADDASEPAPTAAPVAPVFSLDAARARRRRWMAGGVSVLAAAAMVFLVLRPGGGGPETITQRVDYRLDVDGGDKTFRSSHAKPQEVRKLGPDSLLRLTLVPASRSTDAVTAQAWFMTGEIASELAISWDAIDGGALDVETTAKALFGERRGTGALVVAIRPASQPAADSPRAARAAGYRTLRQWIELTD